MDPSSRPGRSPRRVPAGVQNRIERLRRDRKLGPARIAPELTRQGCQISPAGVHRVLVRLGISRLRDLDRPTGERLRAHRYERSRPGELIHIDVKKLGKIRPGGGWRVHGRGSPKDIANHTAVGHVSVPV